MATGICFYLENGMLTTMQDVLDVAIPIWEMQPSLGMCYAVIYLREERVFSSDIIIAVLWELRGVYQRDFTLPPLPPRSSDCKVWG